MSWRIIVCKCFRVLYSFLSSTLGETRQRLIQHFHPAFHPTFHPTFYLTFHPAFRYQVLLIHHKLPSLRTIVQYTGLPPLSGRGDILKWNGLKSWGFDQENSSENVSNASKYAFWEENGWKILNFGHMKSGISHFTAIFDSIFIRISAKSSPRIQTSGGSTRATASTFSPGRSSRRSAARCQTTSWVRSVLVCVNQKTLWFWRWSIVVQLWSLGRKHWLRSLTS